MAFQSRDLSVLAYANGFTLWHYTTSDPETEVDAAGYFDPAAEMLRAGDVLFANTDAEGAVQTIAYGVAVADGQSVACARIGPAAV